MKPTKEHSDVAAKSINSTVPEIAACVNDICVLCLACHKACVVRYGRRAHVEMPLVLVNWIIFNVIAFEISTPRHFCP